MTDPHPRFTSDDFGSDHPSAAIAALSALVRDGSPHGFDPGFRQRVLSSVKSHRDATIGAALERHFVRIVPLAAAATLLLAGYNWWGGRTTSETTLDAALNLPRVTLAAAYEPAQLFGATIAASENP
ncbi:MAG TPA: hypothetical protein VGM67_05120 [Gemmatimonadaceae bacterium]|jgi:hypothetical protein